VSYLAENVDESKSKFKQEVFKLFTFGYHGYNRSMKMDLEDTAAMVI